MTNTIYNWTLKLYYLNDTITLELALAVLECVPYLRRLHCNDQLSKLCVWRGIQTGVQLKVQKILANPWRRSWRTNPTLPQVVAAGARLAIASTGAWGLRGSSEYCWIESVPVQVKAFTLHGDGGLREDEETRSPQRMLLVRWLTSDSVGC